MSIAFIKNKVENLIFRKDPDTNHGVRIIALKEIFLSNLMQGHLNFFSQLNLEIGIQKSALSINKKKNPENLFKV